MATINMIHGTTVHSLTPAKPECPIDAATPGYDCGFARAVVTPGVASTKDQELEHQHCDAQIAGLRVGC
jgi:hypothetical protein